MTDHKMTDHKMRVARSSAERRKRTCHSVMIEVRTVDETVLGVLRSAW
jgi:hypothetical protein